jgi:predicted Ser/Thr protein kinase
VSSARGRPDATPPEILKAQADPQKCVNQYVLGALLGKGAMGQVWKAWDTKLTRWIALKFLTMEDTDGAKRFEREAKLAARLKHPNIAAIYEVGEDKGRHYIAMELVDGASLNKASLEPRQAIEVIAKVARAVDEAHKAGVIHRDIKPENLMVTKAGWPYVMDFGLAKAVESESSLSVSGDVMGTPIYMSPEQAQGMIEELDARTDVYSLGATLYTLMTGQRPFTGKSAVEVIMHVVHDDVVHPRKINPQIPEPIEAVILKAMEKKRENRYPSAQDLALDLERYLSNLDVEAKLPSITTLILRRLRRNAWPAALFAVLFLGAIGALVAWNLKVRPATPAESRAWMDAFIKDRKALDYMIFNPADPQLAARVGHVHELLLSVAKLPSEDRANEVEDWFRLQIELAEKDAKAWPARPKSEWPGLREGAGHAVEWTQSMSRALEGQTDELAALSTRLPAIRSALEALASFRGEFILRIAVAPYAKLKDLRRNGKSLEIPDHDTPLRLPVLEIDNYEVELTHPEVSGSVLLPLAATQLKPGVTYTVTGDIRKGTVHITP